MTELLPCPFCGSDDVTPELNKMNWPAIQCMECGALGPCIDIDAAKAVERWNERATDEASYLAGQHSLVDVIRAKLDDYDLRDEQGVKT